MLRRKPTAITLTSEDVAAFEDSRIAKAQGAAAENARMSKDAQAADPDPNDELRPLPGDKDGPDEKSIHAVPMLLRVNTSPTCDIAIDVEWHVSVLKHSAVFDEAIMNSKPRGHQDVA
ncbi:MAG: hypothetical protein L6R38_006782 [Xanthoria sp. 2 TBL-2021]|nr:MAG: hypothetical protein L6R38_006782 [Xanthoria sp. 2 TBL-2021]